MLSTAPELAAIGREYLPILLFFGVAIAFALVFVGLPILVSNVAGTNKPYRCKIRPTAFSHLQAMDFMMKGHMLADTTAVLSAIDVVFGECDR